MEGVSGARPVKSRRGGKGIENMYSNGVRAKLSNNCCFQVLSRGDLLLVFVIYDSEVTVFRFWTVRWTKGGDVT